MVRNDSNIKPKFKEIANYAGSVKLQRNYKSTNK